MSNQPSPSSSPPIYKISTEYRCVSQITASLWLPSATIDQECCKVVDEFNQDCSNIVYAPLQSPILKNALKNHCTKSTPTTPKAPPPMAPLIKCFDDVAVEYRCMKEIMAYLWFPGASIGQECCKVVNEFNEDCSSAVYAPLQSPLLKNTLKNHCKA